MPASCPPNWSLQFGALPAQREFARNRFEIASKSAASECVCSVCAQAVLGSSNEISLKV